MNNIIIYFLEINGIECQLFWCEVGGSYSFIRNIEKVEFISKDDYFDLCVIEEWVTMSVIDSGRKEDKLIDDYNNVVIDLFILDSKQFFEDD